MSRQGEKVMSTQQTQGQTTNAALERVRQQWQRCQAGEYTLAESLWWLVQDTGGFDRSPWVWLVGLDRNTLQAMMHRETVSEARELINKCRSGDLVANVEGLRLICANQDDKFFEEIGLTRDELDGFVHDRWLEKGLAAVDHCRKRANAGRCDPVALRTISEARQHGISLLELGLTLDTLVEFGFVLS